MQKKIRSRQKGIWEFLLQTGKQACYTHFMGSQSASRRPTLHFGGADPSDQVRKGGEANDYIRGVIPVLYIHCSPRGIVLYDLPGK